MRLLLTSQDVIHAWWVPDFGAKRDVFPGFITELWIKVSPGKEGLYRGQCAALCGRVHGFMPIVVDVRTPDDFVRLARAESRAQTRPDRASPELGNVLLKRVFPLWTTQSPPTMTITTSHPKATSAGFFRPITRTSQ